MVPELTRGEDEIVVDSEVILHWLDDNYHTNLYPTKESSDLSVRASDGILGGAVLYYNWVFEDGWYEGRITNWNEEEGEYYFAWVDDGKIVLRSQSPALGREPDHRGSSRESLGYVQGRGRYTGRRSEGDIRRGFTPTKSR